MYCPFCSLTFDGPEDGGSCPDCGSEYDYTGRWNKGNISDDGHHETGADAGEGDVLLDDMTDNDRFDW